MPHFKLKKFHEEAGPPPRFKLTKNPADAGKKKLKPRHAKKATGNFGLLFIENEPPEESK
jgi:hypothetical protein